MSDSSTVTSEQGGTPPQVRAPSPYPKGGQVTLRTGTTEVSASLEAGLEVTMAVTPRAGSQGTTRAVFTVVEAEKKTINPQISQRQPISNDHNRAPEVVNPASADQNSRAQESSESEALSPPFTANEIEALRKRKLNDGNHESSEHGNEQPVAKRAKQGRRMFCSAYSYLLIWLAEWGYRNRESRRMVCHLAKSIEEMLPNGQEELFNLGFCDAVLSIVKNNRDRLKELTPSESRRRYPNPVLLEADMIRQICRKYSDGDTR